MAAIKNIKIVYLAISMHSPLMCIFLILIIVSRRKNMQSLRAAILECGGSEVTCVDTEQRSS